jgi:hypothetical protein
MLVEEQENAQDARRAAISSRPDAAARKGQVLVVGGYGHVGQVVSRTVSQFFPGRVVIAGRSARRAQRFADELGQGASGLAVDISSRSERLDLSTFSVVVMCVDQIDTNFVERCLSAGVDYVDVTANQSSIDAIERLDDVARRYESTGLLSVGLCPGVTNLLAAHAAQHFDTPTKIDLFLMLGSGDRHGEAAVEWTLANLNRPFEVFQDGQRRVVRGMGEHETVQFPGERHPRRAFRFNFPDQRTDRPNPRCSDCLHVALLRFGVPHQRHTVAGAAGGGRDAVQLRGPSSGCQGNAGGSVRIGRLPRTGPSRGPPGARGDLPSVLAVQPI